MVAVVVACLALATIGDADTRSRARTSADAVRDFQEGLFLWTRDSTAIGSHAIDLYWKSAQLSSARPAAKALDLELAALYQHLAGDRVARVALQENGWTARSPRSRLILAQGQAFNGVLLVIWNETDRPQEFTVKVRSRSWHGVAQQLQLYPGEATAFAPQLCASQLGPFALEIEVVGEQKTTLHFSGEVRPAVRIRLRVFDPNGDITPARIYIRDANGISCTPANAFDRVMWMTGEHYFYTSGTSKIVLPAGKFRLEIRKGFDTVPIVRQLTLRPVRSENLDFHLRWLYQMQAASWYSGDDHIHGNYTGEPWSAPSDDLRVVRAEGLDVGNMMVSNSTGDTIHDERYFEGRMSSISHAGTILYWNQEMRTGSFGHLVLLNLKHLVQPLYTGFPESRHWEDYPSNLWQAQQAHQQGGIVVYAHPALQFEGFPTGSLAGESVADVALGGVDAFEVFCSHDEPSMELWYRFLNLGFKVRLAGGSDAFLNQRFSLLAGGERTYVYTGPHLDYANWIEGLTRGHAFATVGPLLVFDRDSEQPGGERSFVVGPAKIRLGVRVFSAIPMTKLEIVVNGSVAAKVSNRKPTHHLRWRSQSRLTQSSWIAVRVWGPNNDRIANGPSRWSQRRSPSLVLLAHSSPSYVSIANQPIFSAADRQFCLQWLDALTQRMGREGKFDNNAQRQEILATLMRARAVYENLGAQEKEQP